MWGINVGKKIFKSILILVTIILLVGCVCGVYLFIDSIKFTRQSGGTVLEANKSISFDCNSNYKYLEFKLDINATNCKNIVSYYIKDTFGNVVDYGQVDSSKKTLSLDKIFMGKEGTWRIEFANASEDEKIGVTYTFEGRNTKVSKENR